MPPKGAPAAMPAKKSSTGQREKFWVVQQHDQADVVQSDTMPSREVAAGERTKNIQGPYYDRGKADAVASAIVDNGLEAKARARGLR